MSLSPSPMPGLTSLERSVLGAGVRAPSPHNAQPWRFRKLGDGRFELIYALADKLLCDPDDRDAYLSLGALLELMTLRAGQEGSRLHFQPAQQPIDEGIVVGTIELAGAATADLLAAHMDQRRTNRHPYARTRLPVAMQNELHELGCLFIDSDAMAMLVDKASVLAWKDRNFTLDLEKWTRFTHDAEDGMTCRSLRLNRLDQQFLKLALRLGTLPAPLAHLYATRDVYLTKMSSALAVLSAPDMAPESLLDAGRRLLRSWLVITGRGYASHPMSIVIDQETKHELAEKIGHPLPVAIFRVGRTDKQAAGSGRRPLDKVLLA